MKSSCSGRFHVRALGLLSLLGVLAGLSTSAQAVPSYTRQTGQECATCHVGSFGPQLTPYGVKFKIGGYTESSGSDTKVPLSAMLVANFTSTAKGQPGGAAPRFSDNNNSALQEASVFLAGKLAENLGSFAQATYSGIDRKLHLDNVDIRYAREVMLAGQSGTLGVSFNNNPTVQDPFHTLPAWRFPYTSSDLAPSPAAAPLLDGGLEQRVAGLTAYAMTDSGIYAELGGYTNFGRGFLENTNVIDPLDPGQKLSGVSPYGRLAYMQDLKGQAYSVGLTAMRSKLRDYGASGPSDQYDDFGIDASYQYLGNRKHVVAVGGCYIYERQKLDATFAGGGADKSKQTLQQWKLSTSYHYDKTYGLTGAYFNTRGSHDAILWANGKPDSAGWIMQADWTPFGKEGSWGAPWANVRLGLQYTAYTKFDGASHNYDGAGRNASDNNTLNAFLWTAF